ncbi:hypothetical protein [Agrobacterium rosae]|uniref:hypothetical protein n=1 Tax=Agrobacterium rosae TaxID=1972867 RepID=UPI003B9E8446
MPNIELPIAPSGERLLTIEIEEKEITFSLDLVDQSEEGRQRNLTFPAFRRHIVEFAEAFDDLAAIHADRKRGEVDKPKNKFWVYAKDGEKSTLYPFRATCVEHDNHTMYITASFVKGRNSDNDEYDRIQFPLDIEVSREIAAALRGLAETLTDIS